MPYTCVWTWPRKSIKSRVRKREKGRYSGMILALHLLHSMNSNYLPWDIVYQPCLPARRRLHIRLDKR
ncbi:hypothetical protein ATANTOWER_006640 [Ataeniobius toweri]|uniref:Uncharacterized protein n=1 Tax=Ataeniobius toweri TaxID=208326 RepID=A0ABU7BXW5_9TELE|nr:hypothetical protein [Ataeniobius toweri]